MRKPITIITASLFVLSYSAVLATLRNVPAEFATIQSAIVASADGDTVLVAPGTYTENLDFGARSIRLLSSDGANSTILQPLSTTATFVKITGGGIETELSGFTLDGGSMTHAIEITNGSQPWIHNNTIINHVTYNANATEIGSYAANPKIEFNLFIHNRSIGGVGIFSGNAVISNNTFDDNSRGYWSQGSGVVAKNNIVTNSVEFGIAGSQFLSNDYNCVFNNHPNYDYGAVAGTFDIDAWPEYCDSALDNYGLDVVSPCLASGEGGGNRGAYGAVCGTNLGPRVVALTVSGAQAAHVTDPTPEISWSYMDPSGQPQSESEIEVGTDPDWTFAELWDPAPFAGAATVQTYDGAELIAGTDYYVRVRVNNGIEWGAWASRSFHTNTPPPAPSLIAPNDNAITTSISPLLSVMPHIDAEGDQQLFSFEVYTDAALTNLVASGSNRPSPWAVSPSLLGENQPHWWRARASDGYEVSPWTDARVFLLDAYNSPPIPGQLLHPVGDIGVPTTAPHFDWEEATDEDPGQASFGQTLMLATDSNFVFSTQIPGLLASEFTFSGLMVAQRYWWKIRFTDSDGLTTDAAPQRFFIPGPGDMNINLDLNMIDVVMVVDVIFRDAAEPSARYLADVNGDCTLDVLDVVRIIDHVFRGGALPLTVCSTPSDALRVPGDYPTINSAIAVAIDGNTVFVAPGLYRENVNFLGKNIHIISESGAEVTLIEPNMTTDPTVHFTAGEPFGTELSGFTLVGGTGQHAILITNGSAPHIHNNIIRDHVTFAHNATAIGSYDANPSIDFNLFIHTRSLGGIGIFSGGGTIQNNTFDDNSRGYWSQGSGVIARNNIVSNSVQFGIGGDAFAVNDYNCVFNNTLEYCCGAVSGPNDLNVLPEYCNPAIEDYRLAPSSPCLGTGLGGSNRGALGSGCVIQ